MSTESNHFQRGFMPPKEIRSQHSTTSLTRPHAQEDICPRGEPGCGPGRCRWPRVQRKMEDPSHVRQGPCNDPSSTQKLKGGQEYTRLRLFLGDSGTPAPSLPVYTLPCSVVSGNLFSEKRTLRSCRGCVEDTDKKSRQVAGPRPHPLSCLEVPGLSTS